MLSILQKFKIATKYDLFCMGSVNKQKYIIFSTFVFIISYLLKQKSEHLCDGKSRNSLSA